MSGAGYLYCFTNAYMPGICKVGKTERQPMERLKEANSDTWSPPVWKCEFSKYVKGYSQKEITIHRVLEDMAEHIARREMFRISVEKVRRIFDLLDEDTTEQRLEPEVAPEPTPEPPPEPEEKAKPKKVLKNAGCRNQKKCFTDGQSIRHSIGEDTWTGTYQKRSNLIEHNNVGYKSLTEFVSKHYENQGIIPQTINAWNSCECFVQERWISTYSLPVI